jgi:hypothetical protein
MILLSIIFASYYLTIPKITLETDIKGNFDVAKTLESVQTQSAELQQRIKNMFSNLTIDIKSPDLTNFFDGMRSQIDKGVVSIGETIKSAFEKLDLSAAGVGIGTAISDGIMQGVNASGLMDKIYASVMEKFRRDLKHAGA